MKKKKKNDNATLHRVSCKSERRGGVRITGGAISRTMVIAIGTGVIKANCPSKLKNFGGHIALTEGWARGVLKSMDWSKRKSATGKVEPSKQFLLEEKLTFQRRIPRLLKNMTYRRHLI